MKKKVLWPIGVLLAGAAAAALLIASRRPAPSQPYTPAPILVRVLPVEFQDVTLSVRSQGAVTPRAEITLSAEVSGRVEWIAPSWASGGFFEAGDPLVKLDPRDFELAVIQARAQKTQAEVALAREEAEAETARKEWQRLGEGTPPPLVVRQPQLAQAEASLEAARAGLEAAERDLARAVVRAPFAGRVREKRVDVGQFVSRGAPLAEIYSIDAAEVRLPLTTDEAEHVDLPLRYRDETEPGTGPSARLCADFAGQRHCWSATIVRTEGQIDTRSRMLYAVARVEDPYSRGDGTNRPPLAAGLFVEATIEGRRVPNAVVIPRTALHSGDQVFVVDERGKLDIRPVDVARVEAERAILRGGLNEGDRVCLSRIDTPVEGMDLRAVLDQEADLEGASLKGGTPP